MPTCVGLLEIRHLLPRFREHLPFFRRFIDDGIDVWLDHPNRPNAWQSFLRCLNTWGALKWTCDGHTDSLVFFDLEVSITRSNKLHFAAYQKPMNLYLYIPPNLAHPDKILQSIVFGRLRAYRLQNSTTTNFIKMSLLLARRLRDRGFSPQTLAPHFREAGTWAMTLPAAGALANACHPGPTTNTAAVATIAKAPPHRISPKIPPQGAATSNRPHRVRDHSRTAAHGP
jgi:hypothetical protein